MTTKLSFSELLKRAKTERIAIHTATEAQAITLLSELDKKGFKWNSGRKLTTETYYEDEEENTCYSFGIDVDENLLNKKVVCGPLNFYQNEGYTIIEFNDIDFKENHI